VNGLAALLAPVAWLAGLVALVRFPIVTTGCAVALLAWRWDPTVSWATLAVTALVSLGWHIFGPSERVLPRRPALAVALAAGAVAVLAGGQAAASALAVVLLALAWSARTTSTAPAHRDDRRPTPAAARPQRAAPVGFLGVGALRVDFGPCPACGGVLVATGRPADDPTRGPVLLAEATCTTCGVQLVGLGDTTTGRVTWIDPDGEATS
jgi:hypothetical protein